MKGKSNFGSAAAWMVVVTLLMALGFGRLYKNQKPYLDMVGELQRSGKSMNLDGGCRAEDLAELLLTEGILNDPLDARATSSHIVSRLSSSRRQLFRNLGVLNSAEYSIPAVYADSAGGAALKARVMASKELLGINDEYCNWLMRNERTVSFTESDSAVCLMMAQVLDPKGKTPVQGVPVRLKRHFYVPVGDDRLATDSTVAYVVTDSLGRASFSVSEGYYSIVPIQEGFEFGASRGSSSDILKAGKHVYSFRRKEHRIPVFAPLEYREVKRGPVLTVRTPETYTHHLKLSAILMFAAWWIAFMLTGVLGRRRRFSGDMMIYPVLMFLSGIGTLSLIGAGNPVLDRPLGFEMVKASFLGLALMCSLSVLPVARIYASGFRFLGFRVPFDPFSKKYNGVSYLGIALLLMVLLALFGTAPAGSSAKVNLFILQPSELCKYLIVIFMAAFFAENAGAIRKFSDKADKVSVPFQIRTMAILAIGIVVVSFLYMGVLSDMGPALVLLISFVFMYSLARRDFGHLILGVVTFLAMTWLARHIWGTKLAEGLSMAAWFVCWIGGSLLFKKRIYESAVFMNLLFVLFVTGGTVFGAFGFTHQAERLKFRMAMMGSGVWDNANVLGGDQVAEAIWGYSTGGMKGQGLGLGNETLIPAYHTDLIMATVGEQMGWWMLFAIIVLMGVLLFRAIRAGRKSGHPFSFYLAFGIGIVTVVQFLLVSLGSTGIIPLTGLAVPFMSYAKTSIVLNLAAFGLLIAISRENAGQYQEEEVRKFKAPLVSSCVSFTAVGALLAIVLLVYMRFDRDNLLVRPGLFANNAGIRAYVYNPRIQMLTDKLHMETIYDRNGEVLATSSKEEAFAERDVIRVCFGSDKSADWSSDKRIKRYYPFGMHTFFMIGDFNDKIQWNTSVSNPSGFNAENRYLARLRGFDNMKRDASGKTLVHKIPILAYKPSRFLPAYKRNEDYRVAEYDYSGLLALLKDGVAGHREIKKLTLEKAAPVHLTIDAVLQTKLQDKLAEYVSQTDNLKSREKLRISVVVLDAATGDLLSSSNYPLPRKEVLDSLEKNHMNVYNERDPHQWAYTERDLGLTSQTHPGSTSKVMTALAAYMKMGPSASNVAYDVDIEEIIENGRVKEPYSSVKGKRVSPNVTMRSAIEKSSNCYFVNLLNDKDLYGTLGQIYGTVGARLDGHEGRNNITPYYFYDSEFVSRTAFEDEVEYLSKEGAGRYADYRGNHRAKGDRRKMSRFNGSADYWGIAYGQGQLYASPLNMARVVSIVANDGYYVSTRYEMDEEIHRTKFVSSGTASLKEDMRAEADKHRRNGARLPGAGEPDRMISKTGTPERTWIYESANGTMVETKPNDGWYICSIYSKSESSPLAIAVRMERLGALGSGAAVRLTAETVLPVLQECGYEIY